MITLMIRCSKWNKPFRVLIGTSPHGMIWQALTKRKKQITGLVLLTTMEQWFRLIFAKNLARVKKVMSLEPSSAQTWIFTLWSTLRSLLWDQTQFVQLYLQIHLHLLSRLPTQEIRPVDSSTRILPLSTQKISAALLLSSTAKTVSKLQLYRNHTNSMETATWLYLSLPKMCALPIL